MKKEKLVVIFYFVLALLWVAATVLQIKNDNSEIWIIIVDVIISILSIITAILHYRNYKKNK